MSRPATPSSRAGGTQRSHREDVMQFLDNLDSYEGATPTAGSGSGSKAHQASGSGGSARHTSGKGSGAAASGAAGAEDPQSVLDFLDEIVTSRERRGAGGPSGSSTGGTAGAGAASASTVKKSSAGSGISRSGSRNSLKESSGRGSYLTPRDSSTPKPAAASPAASNLVGAGSSTAAAGTSTAAQAAEKLEAAPAPPSVSQPSGSSAGGWGWGSVWSQASNIVQQAKTVAEEQVSKNLPKNLPQLPVSPSTASAQGAAAISSATDRAQQWRTGALSFLSNNLSNLDIEKLRKDLTDTGYKALKDVMDAVAPPIAQHEVIQVNLSHDMLGYEGVETLVYRALAKIMEQVPGGDLVVNKGSTEDLPNNEKGARSSFDEKSVLEHPEGDDDERNLNFVNGFTEAYKLAEANLDAMIKKGYKAEEKEEEGESTQGENQAGRSGGGHARSSSITVPVTVCPVYMRIQPVLASLPFASAASSSSDAPSTSGEDKYLFFVILLRDPTNSLFHKTLTQSMPKAWLDIPFEENEWVEDIMVDIIRRGVEILGEEYVKGRMSGRLLKAGASMLGGGDRDKEILFEEKDSEESERESIEMVNASVGVPA